VILFLPKERRAIISQGKLTSFQQEKKQQWTQNLPHKRIKLYILTLVQSGTVGGKSLARSESIAPGDFAANLRSPSVG
jgi:hypothetical protein